MSILDGYSMCGETKERPFLTLRPHTITFSKSSIDLLGRPAFIHAFVDVENRRYAVQPCGEEALAFPFFVQPEPGKQILVRWANKERVSDLTQMLSLKDYPKGVRIYGKHYRDENVIVYDLHDIVPIE